MEEALNTAAEADVVLFTIGGKNGWGITSTVGEGVDSTNIDLPGRQEEFARAIYALHKKTVVLHFDGRPLSNAFIASHFDAILEVWQPGMMGGQALCKVLFGDYNPAGRLPVTAARSVGTDSGLLCASKRIRLCGCRPYRYDPAAKTVISMTVHFRCIILDTACHIRPLPIRIWRLRKRSYRRKKNWKLP